VIGRSVWIAPSTSRRKAVLKHSSLCTTGLEVGYRYRYWLVQVNVTIEFIADTPERWVLVTRIELLCAFVVQETIPLPMAEVSWVVPPCASSCQMRLTFVHRNAHPAQTRAAPR
jgi:hypothetical protein